MKRDIAEKKNQLRQTNKIHREVEFNNKNIVKPLSQARRDIENLSKCYDEFHEEKKLMNKRKKELTKRGS